MKNTEETIRWRGDSEHRTVVVSVIECPECGRDVPLSAETDMWVQEADGRWHHSGYGPGFGDCCGLVFVDSYDGVVAYETPERK